MHEVWPDVDGVVEFPNGVRIRGRRLRGHAPTAPLPDHAVYLTAHRPPAESWSVTWIRWPDFRLPRDPQTAVELLGEALQRGRHERVEIGCPGGRGRTGTALAVIAVIAGVDRAESVDWVRARFHPRAVETWGQRRWIRNLELSE